MAIVCPLALWLMMERACIDAQSHAELHGADYHRHGNSWVHPNQACNTTAETFFLDYDKFQNEGMEHTYMCILR